MIRNSFKALLGLMVGLLLAITSINPANAALPGLVPDFADPVRTIDGFTVQLTNFDPSFNWTSAADAGASSDISGTGMLTVTGANPGTMVTVDVSTSRGDSDNADGSISATSLNAALIPNADTPIRTVDGFTFQITNYDDNFTWSVETSAGAGEVSETGVVRVSGLSPDESAQATVTASRAGYADGQESVVSSALLAGLVPSFGTVTRTATGFDVQITNFDANFTYSVQSTAGSAAIADVSSQYFVVVTGLAANQEATITVVAQRNGFADGSADLTDSTSHACLAGTYSATGYGSCSPAPAGKYVPIAGQTIATPCDLGTFQSSTGQTSCVDAQAGYYVPVTSATEETQCPIGTFQPNARSSGCENAQPGYYVPVAGATSQTQCADGTTSLLAAATACIVQASSSYAGPVLTSPSEPKVTPGQKLTLAGTGLSQVTSVSISGKSADATCTETSCSFTVPEGVSPGLQDLLLLGSHGVLTIQDGIRIDLTGSSESSLVASWTKKLDDSSAKIYAKNLVGAGKVQFFLNGREIAWVNASSSADSKLRTSHGSSYLVRTVELAAGKNILEVYVDGVRTTRTAYTQ